MTQPSTSTKHTHAHPKHTELLLPRKCSVPCSTVWGNTEPLCPAESSVVTRSLSLADSTKRLSWRPTGRDSALGQLPSYSKLSHLFCILLKRVYYGLNDRGHHVFCLTPFFHNHHFLEGMPQYEWALVTWYILDPHVSPLQKFPKPTISSISWCGEKLTETRGFCSNFSKMEMLLFCIPLSHLFPSTESAYFLNAHIAFVEQKLSTCWKKKKEKSFGCCSLLK